MSKGEGKSGWATELARQVPIPAVQFLASYFFFQSGQSTAGWVLLATGLISVALLIRIEVYEKAIRGLHTTIDKQDTRIERYSKLATNSLTDASRSLVDSNAHLTEGVRQKSYQPTGSSAGTETF